MLHVKNEKCSLFITMTMFHEKFPLFDMKPLKIALCLLINLRQTRALEVRYQARIFHVKKLKIFTFLKNRSARTTENDIGCLQNK